MPKLVAMYARDPSMRAARLICFSMLTVVGLSGCQPKTNAVSGTIEVD